MPGTILCNNSEYCSKGITSSIITRQMGLMDTGFLIAKLVVGVACLFIWRIACKKVCYNILPPIYRAFNLPHRKFEIGARYTHRSTLVTWITYL